MVAKFAIVPAFALRAAGRMDAGFFLCPGAVDDAKAARLRDHAARLQALAEAADAHAAAEREACAALGIERGAP